MECSEFRNLYPKYTNFPVPREIWDTEEGERWQKHFVECRDCSDWHQQREVEKRGASVSDYPCVHMAFRATFRCDQHADLRQCSEAPVIYDERWDEYKIGARGGTGDEYVIYHCPWCGARLPESKRDLWFETLAAAGIDSMEDEVPKEYNLSAWRKNLGQ